MKWRVKEHDRPNSNEILEQLRNDEWDYSRDDLMCKEVMWFLSVEEDMNTKQVFQFLIENTDELFTKNDVTMSLRWYGLIPSHGPPLQQRATSILDIMSFNWEFK
ncbi:hypothetical protein HISP_08665 [Haloarcula hispanica N601]|uniref:Uncharacterized protein n=2 Tax=Haloarcula hispanica TaxID=51589 RepID=V5TSC0_HALHI|nr:hypothetical protein HAH_1698 [Haloarcula hispanica ATCC 33960]AHB67489.1 hypothetical protein HISP_08665 [Haloarcula hispanica N601]